MKKVMALLPVLSFLLLIMVVPAISDVHATSPIMATGTIAAGTPTFAGEKTADENTFLTGVFDQDTFTGTLS